MTRGYVLLKISCSISTIQNPLINAINNIVEKANFLTWTGLRHTIPSILKTIEYITFTENTYFTKGNEMFDIAEKKTKDCYSLIISNKAQLPSNAKEFKT